MAGLAGWLVAGCWLLAGWLGPPSMGLKNTYLFCHARKDPKGVPIFYSNQHPHYYLSVQFWYQNLTLRYTNLSLSPELYHNMLFVC